MKDFIKIGCSYALVHVEMKNQGDDAFKPEIYGDLIMLERRISESTSSITLENSLGKKISNNGRDELIKIVEHFNIDVENPCVIMSQDKSREFLNSGSSKDKFRFYFKATLLEQLSDLIYGIGNRLNQANELVGEMEKSLSPSLKEIDEIQAKIRSMEQVEEIATEVQGLKKKLAWSWVYEVDQQLQRQAKTIQKLKGRIPSCQDRINKQTQKMDELRGQMSSKKAKIEDMMVRTSEARRMKAELEQELRETVKEEIELDGDCDRRRNNIQNLLKQVNALERQIKDMQEVDECEMERKMREIQNEADRVRLICQSLRKEEESLLEDIAALENEIKAVVLRIDEDLTMHRDSCTRIHDLKQQQTNRIMAFGGHKVRRLLQVVKAHQHKFQRPPIGPIGTHVSLISGVTWAIAIENAIGWLLSAFIVTNHQDFLRLKEYANPTVMNVLIDAGSAERLVLVKDFRTGKGIAFGDRKISNLKEVYTSDGYKLFSRGSAQTTLPPSRNSRDAQQQRLGSFDKQIKDLERDALQAKEQHQDWQGRKRKLNESLEPLEEKLTSAKRRRRDMERKLRCKELELKEMKESIAANHVSYAHASTVDELDHEKLKFQEEIKEREILLEKVGTSLKLVEEKGNNLKMSIEKLCESAKEDIDSLEKAEGEVMTIEKELHEAEEGKVHFENVMSRKVVSVLKAPEDNYHALEENRKESCRKASIVCPETEIEALGDERSSPDQLSAKLTRLKERLKRERGGSSSESNIDDLKELHERKRCKIMRKQQMLKALKEQVDACKRSLGSCQRKFQRNATFVKRELTWKFNSHLGKKGMSGKVAISYEEKTLDIELTMPQDGSNNCICDTRGLSGGERSFSTLCFALVLHEMTEAPFRAMDEFNVFMDAISRKISLDTLVDFTLGHGCQWIFITPHDVSIVKQDQRIKKQQMAAPRS